MSLHCDHIGNFEELQCDNGNCWCVLPQTGQIFIIIVIVITAIIIIIILLLHYTIITCTTTNIFIIIVIILMMPNPGKAVSTVVPESLVELLPCFNGLDPDILEVIRRNDGHVMSKM